MYLLTAQEMQKLDGMAIRELGIPGVVLMENAGLKTVEAIRELLGSLRDRKVAVFAGKGNNGGDGFVIARHLLNAGADVKVFLLAGADEISGDARINFDILRAMNGYIVSLQNPNSLNLVKLTMAYTDLVVDALFGTGFKGAVSDHVGEVIEIINSSGKPVVAVDIPSGLEANTGRVHGPCVKATRTVTFAYPKLGQVIEQGPQYTGELTVADISIPPALAESLGLKRFLLTPSLVKKMLPARAPDAHKGSFGRILVVGGSRGLSGAAALAAAAALRAGAGLVTLAVPASIHPLMEVKLTEVMTRPLPETEAQSFSLKALPHILDWISGMDVLALGPGLSTEADTVHLVRELVPLVDIPMVIDADGLNALAGAPDLLRKCRAPVVPTPHPGEMARMLGIKTAEVQNNRIETALEAARRFNATVVLKGFRTVVADSEGTVYVNTTGNPGMATGGSGDILTGVIAALLGQGLAPREAAAAGAYLHGAAGDRAAEEKGMMSLIAGDLLDFLPAATKALQG